MLHFLNGFPEILIRMNDEVTDIFFRKISSYKKNTSETMQGEITRVTWLNVSFGMAWTKSRLALEFHCFPPEKSVTNEHVLCKCRL